MNVEQLIEHLQMMPKNMAVFLQTVPEDFATPMERKNIAIWEASVSDKYGLEPAKLVLTVLPKS